MRYNSKLDKAFQKKFEVKWEGLFLVIECFPNGTYQLADLDGTLHASRIDGLCLKNCYTCLMAMTKNDISQTGYWEETTHVDDEMGINAFFFAYHE